MKAQGNKLQEMFKALEKEIKSRGGQIKKDDFYNDIADSLPKGKLEELRIKYSPFEYLSTKRMEESPDFLHKVRELYEQDTGVRL